MPAFGFKAAGMAPTPPTPPGNAMAAVQRRKGKVLEVWGKSEVVAVAIAIPMRRRRRRLGTFAELRAEDGICRPAGNVRLGKPWQKRPNNQSNPVSGSG